MKSLMGGWFGVLFISARKYVTALFLIMIYASASPASADDIGLFSALTTYPTKDSLKNTSVEINSDCFGGYFTSLSSVSKDMPLGSASECLEETVAITLNKDGDKIIWSLAPSFSRYSLNPIEDLKNIQVLLRYRF